MPMKTGDYRVLRNQKLTRDVFDLTVHCPALAEVARPGQFAQLAAPGCFLRRPISICRIDKQNGTLRFVFQVRGEGTARLGTLSAGDMLSLIGPLGHGFILPESGRVLFVGGGIGTPPLLEAAAQVSGRAFALLGFQSGQDVILTDAFRSVGCGTEVATNDGSGGYKGYVTGLLAEKLKKETIACICACGPTPMLKATAQMGQDAGIPVQVSMEAHMACGMGACLVCACKTRGEDGETRYRHVCKDGPVFDSREVVFE